MTPAWRSLKEAKPAGSSVGRSDSIEMLSDPPRLMSAAPAGETAISNGRESASTMRRAAVERWTIMAAFLCCRQERQRGDAAPNSDRPVALHGHPEAGAGVRPVVPHRAVLCAAVVPERDRVLAPAEAALKQRV